MDEKLIHEVIPVGILQCNCSILGDPESREAIVVDPGDDVERILQILRRHNLKVRAIVSTHTHIDHVGGLAALHRATGAPVLIHEADLGVYATVDMQAQWLGVPAPELLRIRDFVKEGDSLRWGPFEAKVLHTPGHTPGSISLMIAPRDGETEKQPRRPRQAASAHEGTAVPGRLLAGDTLFQGSIGRTDLPGGSFEQIIKSIHEKVLVLPDDTIVLPGHGNVTSVGAEKEHNPFLR